MMKVAFILLLAFGFSLQTPVEDTDASTTVAPTPNVTEEPEVPEMNPYGECPEIDDEFPTYLSDFKNCSVFYQCSNGVPYRMTCRYPLEFNPTLHVCDFPHSAGCIFDKMRPYTMIGRCPPTTRPGHTKFLRDATDNTIYYECVDGEAVVRQCPEGTYFNFRKVCQPIEQVEDIEPVDPLEPSF